ncbi:hypothetical protein JTB14_023731 [Gonioctena quinquepunctata]|nr:hypothetical protein JTB14_023731 [Gonioctena quinquepunctata]
MREGNEGSMAFKALMNNNTRSNSVRGKFQGKCIYCNEVGHIADKWRITKECRICKKTNHEEKYCYFRDEKFKRNQTFCKKDNHQEKGCFKNKENNERVSFLAEVLTTTKENTPEEELLYENECKEDIFIFDRG